jgi:hypothetical protein
LHWWLLPPLPLLFPVILTVSKNIMKPARVPNIARPVKTAAGVGIVLKTAALAAFAGNCCCELLSNYYAG